MRTTPRLFAICGSVAALACAGSAAAAGGGTTPAPATPGTEDPSPIAGQNITFTLKKGLPRSLEGKVFFEVARGAQTENDGTLKPGTLPADDDAPELRTFLRAMKWKDGRFTYTLSAKTFAAIRNFWANQQGKYAWKPFVIDCAAVGATKDDCALEGKTNTFTVVPAAASDGGPAQ